MKILFVMPKHGRGGQFIPYSFTFLSAYLRKYLPGVSINHIDVNLRSMEELKNRIKKTDPDIVALTGLTSHYAGLKEAVSLIQREKKDKTKVIVGGAIISSYPEFMIGKLGADYYIIGEGEEAFLDLVRTISLGKDGKNIKNIGFKENGKVTINEARPLINNLDELPLQDYDIFGLAEYTKKYHTARIFASRGCPFNCNFCYRLYGPAYRVRSVESVIGEIKFLIKKYKIFHVEFIDELFFLNKNRIEDFCREILKENLKVTWQCAMRVNLIDRDILRMMKKAGCVLISYGIESGSQPMLAKMNKRTTVEQNIKAIEEAKKAGIFPDVNCIIGYPGETKETIKETEKMLEKTKCHAGLHFVQALPGCALYKEIKEAGFIKNEEEYFINLGEHIQDLPLDFTGLSKEFIEQERKRIMANLNKYYLINSRNLKWQRFKFYLTKGNINFFKYLILKRILRLT